MFYQQQVTRSTVKRKLLDTAHNIGVTEAVCKELKVEDVLPTFLCNIHPLMMFDRKIKELCQKIHDCLGGNNLLTVSL